MSRAFSLAGFEVTLIGRFWVTPEEWKGKRNYLFAYCLYSAAAVASGPATIC
jgi:hypothetical protein